MLLDSFAKGVKQFSHSVWGGTCYKHRELQPLEGLLQYLDDIFIAHIPKMIQTKI